MDEELYYSTDLTYTEVHLRCKEIQAKKMLDISDITIQGWYAEFLKAGWSSKKFKERAETIKNLRSGEDYFGNGIDVSHWLNEELIMLTRAEFEQKVQRRIKESIFRGNLLLQEYSQLFKVDDDDLILAITTELTAEYENHRQKLFDVMLIEKKKGMRKIYSEARGKILEMTGDERKQLLAKAINQRIIAPADEKEKEILLENLEAFTDKLMPLL